MTNTRPMEGVPELPRTDIDPKTDHVVYARFYNPDTSIPRSREEAYVCYAASDINLQYGLIFGGYFGVTNRGYFCMEYEAKRNGVTLVRDEAWEPKPISKCFTPLKPFYLK